MKCKHHPNRDAEHYCASCGIPICSDCVEEVKRGEYYCFQCAMFQTVSGVGSSLKEKKERASDKKAEKKIKLGPFHYFLIMCSVMIIVMWGVILFGGKKPLGKSLDVDKNPRVFLFMVDSAIKRYNHYEGNKYPEKLVDLVPKYLALGDDNISHLDKFNYQLDENKGYTLSPAKTKFGDMKITMSAKGITYELVKSEAVKNE